MNKITNHGFFSDNPVRRKNWMLKQIEINISKQSQPNMLLSEIFIIEVLEIDKKDKLSIRLRSLEDNKKESVKNNQSGQVITNQDH